MLNIDGIEVTVASYHAHPGATWFERKRAQAAGFARPLAEVVVPALFDADANTPLS